MLVIYFLLTSNYPTYRAKAKGHLMNHLPAGDQIAITTHSGDARSLHHTWDEYHLDWIGSKVRSGRHCATQDRNGFYPISQLYPWSRAGYASLQSGWSLPALQIAMKTASLMISRTLCLQSGSGSGWLLTDRIRMNTACAQDWDDNCLDLWWKVASLRIGMKTPCSRATLIESIQCWHDISQTMCWSWLSTCFLCHSGQIGRSTFFWDLWDTKLMVHGICS